MSTGLSLFVLCHVHGDDPDNDIELGTYSSMQAVEESIARLYRHQPGFMQYPDGYRVCEFLLDKDHPKEYWLTENWIPLQAKALPGKQARRT